MTNQSKGSKFVLALLACFAALLLCVSPALAQTSSTGALTGTVTDPSGAVIVGAAVTATNIGTGAERSTTTDANGAYKVSLLPPGNYRVKFSAPGFKTAEVSSVTVNVTETATLNHGLELGAQTEKITVESTAVTVQTENATVGGLVSSKTVTDLPLSSRNYTNIIDLSPGVVANVASAAAVGNGTQDINVNGMGSDQNNYMMDGAVLTNYGSGGGAQSGNFPGIGIPNPDAIQEFKIQTSQFDAGYGRNPGASVNVVTKSGTNKFHGAAWEFFRNSFLDANDFFNKASEKSLGAPNKPEILNENMFGGTIGGPIKKDKLFFFGSYQGIRQRNSVGTNGFGTGLATGLQLLPFSEPNGGRSDTPGLTVPLNMVAGGAPCDASTYRKYLGCAFANNMGLLGVVPGLGPQNNFGTATPVFPDGSNINQVAINILQAPGPKGGLNQGFYVPSVPFGSNGLPITNNPISYAQPIVATENQYVADLDYVISPKNQLSAKFFTSKDPQLQPFVCLGFVGAPGVNNCQPGAPERSTYTADSGTLKLTTVATGNLVNEAVFSFQRSTFVGAPADYLTACSVGITPPLALVPGSSCASLASAKGINAVQLQIPTLSIFGLPMINVADGPVAPQGAWNNGGNFFASATNFFNNFQGSDQISWNHGKHAIRTGFWVDRIQYNWTLPGRGGLAFATVADFLTSASGLPGSNCAYGAGSPACTSPATNVPGGVFINFFGLTMTNGNAHYARSNEFAAFVQDDIKLTRKLTLNLGVRWEYDGYPSDASGLFTNAWPTQAALVNTGSFFLGNEVLTGPPSSGPVPNNNLVGTLAGFVVQSNYKPNIAQCGNPLAPTACGLTAPVGLYPANAVSPFAYPGGATGVFFNTNKTLVHGAPIHNFGPRIGLAWQPFGEKFVVRAGYGIFYDAPYANLLENNQGGNPPYNGFINGSAPTNTLDVPVSVTGGILGWQPRTLAVVQGTASTGATVITDNTGGQGLGATSDSEFLSLPLVQEYNLDLQYEVAPNWVVDVGYVGTHGTHLYDWARPINMAFLAPNAPNEPTDAQNKRMILGSGAPGTPTSFPFNDINNTNPATQILSNTGSNAIGRVSYLGYGTGGMSTTSTVGDSLYNSLQAQLRHQFAHGLMLQVSYTWSKLLTNINAPEAGTGIAAPGNVLSGGASSNDALDFGQQYGLAAFNRPQRLIIAYSYDLPYKHTKGFAGHVLGGWTISGVTTIQDGLPFTVTDGNGGRIYYGSAGVAFGGGGGGAELAAANPGKCNAAGGCQGIGLATSGRNQSRLGGAFGGPGWINAAAYTSTPCIGGTAPGDCAGSGGATGFGNSGVGALMGPGQHNWDMSIMKNTKLTEGTTLQFRAEFYNLWNHPQFNGPVNDISNSFFGGIFSSSVPPRIMQFALKFLF